MKSNGSGCGNELTHSLTRIVLGDKGTNPTAARFVKFELTAFINTGGFAAVSGNAASGVAGGVVKGEAVGDADFGGGVSGDADFGDGVAGSGVAGGDITNLR